MDRLSRSTCAWLLVLGVVMMVASTFVFEIRQVDTESYVDQIVAYRDFSFPAADSYAGFRAFKAFYGVAGIALPFFSPENVLLVVNALFLLGLCVLTYLLFKELEFSPPYVVLGTFWFMTGYPLLAYGFAWGTDISGWFFSVATIVSVLMGIRTGKSRYLVLASLLGFLGASSKETGVLGLVFGGVYLLSHLRAWGFAKTLHALLFLSLPFLALEAILMGIFYSVGMPTFLEWLSWNNSEFGDYHTLKFFIGAEIATFSALWIPIGIGAYALARKKIILAQKQYYELGALFIAALPVLAWPFFTDRILFIQCLALIPLALYGARFLFEKIHEKHHGVLRIALYAIPLMASMTMALIGGHDGLYRFADYLMTLR